MFEYLWITHNSLAYWQAVDLRHRVLRFPLGLHFAEKELLEESDSAHLVVRHYWSIMGCLIMKPGEKDVVKMRQVAVDPLIQHRGVGKQMVSMGESWAMAQGFQTIRLHARETAVPFYVSQHYKPLEGPFEEVGIPHFVMEKKLHNLKIQDAV